MSRPLATLTILSMITVLDAQEGERPTRAERPAAIVLLTRQAPALDVGEVRRRVAKTLATEVLENGGKGATWLAEDARGLVGAHEGVAFTVRVSKERLPLEETMIGHLEEEQVAALRSHQAQVVVACEAFHEGRTTQDYRLLGRVAAALLDAHVVGVGARHHGTFEAVDEKSITRLQAEDPLAALEAQLATSLIVLLKKSRQFEEAPLREALEKEFETRLSTEKNAEDNFVVAAGPSAVLKLRGELVMVSVQRRWAAVDELAEGAARARLRGHRAVLHVAVFGPAGKEEDRRRLVARVVAALWNDDCLGLNWHCDPALALADADTVMKLRQVNPVVATVGNPVLRADDEAEMDRAIERARQTWQQAADHLAAGGELSAKFPFATRSGSHEHIWISVTKLDGGKVHGTIANDPADIEGLQLGSVVVCKLAELSDWLFVRDGKMVGGFTVEVLRRQDERRQGDPKQRGRTK